MKKRISFKLWISVLIGGVLQFFRNIFSWKNKTPFWIVIWSIITVCIVAFVGMLSYAFYDEFFGRRQRYQEYYATSALGSDYYFYNAGPGKSYIARNGTKKKIHTGLDWIARSEDGDSLVVFAKEGKRGYLSSKSSHIIIPAKYDAAWCFNEGLAAVCEGDSVYFIDHSGNQVFKRKFKREQNHDYMFHGDYFANKVGDKYGLVDKLGKDHTPLIYESLFAMSRNMWAIKYNGKMGALDDEGILVVPNEYTGVEIYPEGGIVVMKDDNSKMRLDYDGKVLDDFVYESAFTLEYYSDELDEEGNRVRKPANAWCYLSNGHYGLLARNGRPITPPIYNSIEAFSADSFECQIAPDGERIIINSHGEK